MGRDRFWIGASGEGSLDYWASWLPRHPTRRRRGHLSLHFHSNICLFLAGQAQIPPTSHEGRRGARFRLDGG